MAKRRKKRITTKQVQATENTPPPAIPHVEVRPETDEDAWGENGLTIRQQKFVDAIIGPAGGNATKAAEMAGYASDNRIALKSTAARLLTFVNVREAIARRLASANLTADWVRQMTAALAASNMGSFLTLGDDGKPIIDWKQAEARGAFVQIRKYKEKGIEVNSKVEIVERQIETHNPSPYLQLLARLLGLTDDKAPQTNVTVQVDNKFDYDSFAREFEKFAERQLHAGCDEAAPRNRN
jgi:hypothetical protein